MEQKKYQLTENGAAHRDYPRELAEIIHSRISPPALREKVADYHENDVAAALELLSREDRACIIFWTQKPCPTFWSTPLRIVLTLVS